ncbi:DUF6220 domain-containing protein [Nonomuraea jiangxiensis]|uniref:Uncharacterized protein n=1 Tax=Nonomuraea jiangxiensis TaxID=633440 RepID=A0A1G8ILS3_9ACTN|nr:DUF6220 domain-containing protein [Nonomuraea jiangxiensis]SDI19737.1 hypothetical protein SAMN05421869_104528 [Nonomuraea jiangxiensis]
MSKVIIGLAGLLLGAVVVQFYLAAVGAFDPAPTEEAFQPHRVLGYSILALAVVVTLVAAVARMPGRLIGTAGLLVGLVLVQALIRQVAASFGDASAVGPFVFGLHAVNGLLIMGVIEMIMRQARQVSQKAAEPTHVAS